jgi:hypothetical protein
MQDTLFKFANAQGVAAILSNESIFITSPLDLNDPFEMRPSWTNAHEDRFRNNQETLDRLATGLPIFAAMEGGRVEQIGTYPERQREQNVDVDDQYGIADLHHKGVFEYLHERFRILSWVRGLLDIEQSHGTSDEKATLMWAHYADSFQGACIAVDPAEINNGLQDGGFEVSYDPVRRFLPPDYYDVLRRERCTVAGITYSATGEAGILIPEFSRDEVEFDQFLSLLKAKSPAWSYENEVRFIYDYRSFKTDDSYIKVEFACERCSAKGKSIEDCSNPQYRDSVKLPSKAVKAVIIGVDAHPIDVKRILEVVSEDRYQHVKLFWSSLHSEHYQTQYSNQQPDYIVTMQEARNQDMNTAKGNRLWDGDQMRFIAAKKGTSIDVVRISLRRENLTE